MRPTQRATAGQPGYNLLFRVAELVLLLSRLNAKEKRVFRMVLEENIYPS